MICIRLFKADTTILLQKSGFNVIVMGYFYDFRHIAKGLLLSFVVAIYIITIVSQYSGIIIVVTIQMSDTTNTHIDFFLHF